MIESQMCIRDRLGTLCGDSRASSGKVVFDGKDITDWQTAVSYTHLDVYKRQGLNQSEDPAAIAKYLKANSVDTVMGPLSWDQTGDLKGCLLYTS